MRVESQEYFEKTIIANHGYIYGFDKAEYRGGEFEIEICCKKHGNYFKVNAGTLLRRTERNGGNKKNPIVGSCPICRIEYFEQIKKDFIHKCKVAHNYNYEYREYVNMATPLIVICEEHGDFKVNPQLHSNGKQKCPYCYSRRNQNIKHINDRKYYICHIHGDVPISNYRASTKGCPICNEIENQKKLKEKQKIKINKKFGKHYDIFIIEDYMEFRCKIHGERITFNTKNFSQYYRKKIFCIKCQKIENEKLKKSKKLKYEKKCKDFIKTNYNNFYEFIELLNYDSGNPKLKLLNLLSNKEKIIQAQTVLMKQLSTNVRFVLRNYLSYEEAREKIRKLGINDFRQYKKWYKRTQQTDLPTNPQRHYLGKGWVSYNEFFGNDEKDQMSYGERRIASYLLRKNIEYVFQKRYEDCKNINTLPFDFYVPKYNLIIEFDGYHHYYDVKKYNRSLEEVKKYDEIKNKYCKNNNINIIRIPYWELEDNVIEWTLDNEITKIAAII